jgi:hypothetical protein
MLPIKTPEHLAKLTHNILMERAKSRLKVRVLKDLCAEPRRRGKACLRDRNQPGDIRISLRQRDSGL